MVKKFAETEHVALLIMVTVLLAALPASVQADMAVQFYNNLNNKMLLVHCYSAEQDMGGNFLHPKDHFTAFSLPDQGGDMTHRNWGGTRIWCEFQAPGKPYSYVNVFIGTGGAGNQPCECTGESCQWTVSEKGFSCGPKGYAVGWG